MTIIRTLWAVLVITAVGSSIIGCSRAQNQETQELLSSLELTMLPEEIFDSYPESLQQIEMSELPRYLNKKVIIEGYPSSVKDYGFNLLDGTRSYVQVKLASFPIPKYARDVVLRVGCYKYAKLRLEEIAVGDVEIVVNQEAYKHKARVSGVYKGAGVFVATEIDIDGKDSRYIYPACINYSYSRPVR